MGWRRQWRFHPRGAKQARPQVGVAVPRQPQAGLGPLPGLPENGCGDGGASVSVEHALGPRQQSWRAATPTVGRVGAHGTPRRSSSSGARTASAILCGDGERARGPAPDGATWTRPEPSGRAFPPRESRPQPDPRGPQGACALGWEQRTGVLRRAAATPKSYLLFPAFSTSRRTETRPSPMKCSACAAP